MMVTKKNKVKNSFIKRWKKYQRDRHKSKKAEAKAKARVERLAKNKLPARKYREKKNKSR